MPTPATPTLLPLLDLAILADLEGQLEDPQPARAFARDYIRGFADRFLRLNCSIGDRDQPAALEAALSLLNASVMVGAARLSAMAAGLRSAVASDDLGTARRALPAIERCGLDTISELEACYLAYS